MIKITSWIFRLVLLLPFAILSYQLYSGDIGADPAKTLNHKMGQIGLYYLLLNLLVGALISYSFRFPKALRFLLLNRRYLGIVTFLYLIFHVLLYLTMEGFEAQAFSQIFSKPYLIFGFLAWMILLIMTLTSNDFSVRRLGAKKWKRLHRAVYVATALITVHVLSIEKTDLIKYGIIFSLLWLIQLPRLRNFRKL